MVCNAEFMFFYDSTLSIHVFSAPWNGTLMLTGAKIKRLL